MATKTAKDAANSNLPPALASVLAQIRKEFGEGAIMRMGHEGQVQKIEAIPTGALTLDLALGIGGVPRGRMAVSTRSTSGLASRRDLTSFPREKSHLPTPHASTGSASASRTAAMASSASMPSRKVARV